MAEQDVAAARRLLSLIASSERHQQHVTNTPPERVDRAHAELELRYRRFELFGSRFATEAPFAILLALYTAEQQEGALSVRRLVERALLTQATTLRWIDLLVQEQLIDRCPDAVDGRKVLLQLTPKGRNAVDELFA